MKIGFVPTRYAFIRDSISYSCMHRAAAAESSIEPNALWDLVRAAQAGDMDAQGALVRLYRNRLRGFVRSMISDISAVDDVVQITFIKMVRRLSLLREAATFEPWLFTLARNSSLDFIRRRRQHQRAFAPTAGEMPEGVAPDSTRAVKEIMEALDSAMALLSPRGRALVTLYIQGHTYQIIAARHGMTEMAVKAALNRARPLLRKVVGAATGTRQVTSDERRRVRTPRLAA